MGVGSVSYRHVYDVSITTTKYGQTMNTKKRLHVDLRLDDHEALADIANKSGVNVSTMVRLMVSAFLRDLGNDLPTDARVMELLTERRSKGFFE